MSERRYGDKMLIKDNAKWQFINNIRRHICSWRRNIALQITIIQNQI